MATLALNASRGHASRIGLSHGKIFLSRGFCSLPTSAHVGKKVLVTGVKGRLGPSVKANLEKKGIVVVGSTSRPTAVQHPDSDVHLDLVHHDSSQMQKVLKKHKIAGVINLATAFGVKPKLAMAVNAYGVESLAKATQAVGIPMIHTSTVLALREGINVYDHPYAFSKLEGDKRVKDMEHVSIVFADTLLADPSNSCNQAEMSFMASLPLVNIQLDAQEQTIQPTTYRAASQAVANSVLLAMSGEEMPKDVVLGGEPIQIRDFIRLVNKNALIEVLVKPESLMEVSRLVHNGVLDPEFIKLTTLAQDTGIPRHPTEPFQVLHGEEPIPSVEQVAQETAAGLTLWNTARMGATMFRGADWGATWAGLKALPSARVTVAPKIETE